MATLAELIQGLPQELFDRIAEHTFATPDLDGQKPTKIEDTTLHVTIDKSYKPPFHLQVNRATRAAFAEKYYNNVRFIAPQGQSDEILCRWVKSLDYAHRKAICFIQLEYDTQTDASTNALRKLSLVEYAIRRDCDSTCMCVVKALYIKYVCSDTLYENWIDWDEMSAISIASWPSEVNWEF